MGMNCAPFIADLILHYNESQLRPFQAHIDWFIQQ